MLNHTWSTCNASRLILAFDRAKAFDSVSPDTLARSLRRFGCPDGFVDVVRATHSERNFVVKDFGTTSGIHQQRYGICQGRPLSPFLFTIMMTTLLTDAHALLQSPAGPIPDGRFPRDLMYADDTIADRL